MLIQRITNFPKKNPTSPRSSAAPCSHGAPHEGALKLRGKFGPSGWLGGGGAGGEVSNGANAINGVSKVRGELVGIYNLLDFVGKVGVLDTGFLAEKVLETALGKSGAGPVAVREN